MVRTSSTRSVPGAFFTRSVTSSLAIGVPLGDNFVLWRPCRSAARLRPMYTAGSSTRFSLMSLLPSLMVTAAPIMPKAPLAGVMAAKSGLSRSVSASSLPLMASSDAALIGICCTLTQPAITALATTISTRNMANLPVGENGAIFSLSFRSCLARLAGGEPGEILWRLPEAIAAPGDVQVGPQKDQVQAVEIAGDRIRDVEHLERRPERFESLL